MNDRPKRDVIHRQHLFGGRATAEEVNARLGFRQPCGAPGCGNLPVIQVKMLMQHDEFVKRAPREAMAIAATNPNGPYIPCAPTKYGAMVMFSKVSACRVHQKDLELEAAKAPSWVLVEINRGPGADKPVVQVVLQG